MVEMAAKEEMLFLQLILGEIHCLTFIIMANTRRRAEKKVAISAAAVNPGRI